MTQQITRYTDNPCTQALLRRWLDEANYLRGIGLPILQRPADWNRLGKSAGYIRNAEMAKECDYALGFSDGKSRGTMHMINILTRSEVPHNVVMF